MTYQKEPANNLPDHADHLQNDARTCPPSDTRLTQPGSRDVLPKGYTYFVQDGDMIKIGSSMRPEDRISALQTGSARHLDVLAIVSQDIADEFGTHQRFAHLRVRGEWFRAEPDLLEFIEAIKAHKATPIEQPSKLPAKPQPAKSTPAIIKQLHALRRAHGAESAIGYRCSNLTEMIPNYQAATDPNQRASLAAGIQRQMADIARLRAAFQ